MTTQTNHDPTFQILINSLLLDAPINSIEYVWSSTKDVLRSMALLWSEPILDSKSLLDLSIGILLLDHISANIQRYKPKMTTEDAYAYTNTNMNASPAMGSDTKSLDGMDSLLSGDILFGSRFIAVLGGFALALSCLAHVPQEPRFFAPRWFLFSLPRHRHRGGPSSAHLMYFLLLLFCLESMLIVSILMFGIHAITFPEQLEEDVKILTSLMVAWFTSLLASSFVRYYLYYSIGD